MPRDCTADNISLVALTMYSPPGAVDPIQLISGPIAFAMQKSNQKRTKATKPRKQKPQAGARAGAVPPKRTQSLAQTSVTRTNPSRIMNSVRTDGRITVKHREFIADIGLDASTTFGLRSFAVNPGLDSLFIWLSRIANNYEYYEFRHLAFEYVPTCSAIDAGSVMLAMDFDAGDSPPATKQEFMSYLGATQGPVWTGIRYVCDKPDLHKFGRQKFTRPSTLTANRDVKTYDIGNFYIATTGVNTNKGSLYVEYEVDLSTPHVNPVDAADQSGYVRSTSSTKAAPLNGAQAYNSSEELTVSLTDNNTDFKVLEAGEYLLDLTAYGTGLTAVDFTNYLSELTGADATFASTNFGAVKADGTQLSGNQTRLKLPMRGGTIRLNTGATAWTTVSAVVLKVLPWLYTYAH